MAGGSRSALRASRAGEPFLPEAQQSDQVRPTCAAAAGGVLCGTGQAAYDVAHPVRGLLLLHLQKLGFAVRRGRPGPAEAGLGPVEPAERSSYGHTHSARDRVSCVHVSAGVTCIPASTVQVGAS